MTQGERVKEIRKLLNLTLDKFGSKLGVGKTAISKIEKGENNLTDQMIKNICKTDWDGKMVNEEWLRTEEGNMFLELPEEDEYFKTVTQLQKDPLAVAIIMEYKKWDDATKKNFKDLILKAADAIKDEKHEE